MGSVPWWVNAIAGVVSMATAVNFFAMAYGDRSQQFNERAESGRIDQATNAAKSASEFEQSYDAQRHAR